MSQQDELSCRRQLAKAFNPRKTNEHSTDKLGANVLKLLLCGGMTCPRPEDIIHYLS